jgi:hypothetical protein
MRGAYARFRIDWPGKQNPSGFPQSPHEWSIRGRGACPAEWLTEGSGTGILDTCELEILIEFFEILQAVLWLGKLASGAPNEAASVPAGQRELPHRRFVSV